MPRSTLRHLVSALATCAALTALASAPARAQERSYTLERQPGEDRRWWYGGGPSTDRPEEETRPTTPMVVRMNTGLSLQGIVGITGDWVDEDTGRRIAGGLALGIGGAVHFGVRLDDLLLALLVHANYQATITNGSGRTYGGVGPALMIGGRLRDLRIEGGLGVDYGSSTANGRSFEGAFVTIHGRFGGVINGGPVEVGTHGVLAIPPDAPELVGMAMSIHLLIRTR